MHKVYIQTDTLARITAINSDAFLTSLTDWAQIDAGEGDKFHHAQGNYLPKSLTTQQGVYQYKYDVTKPMGQQAVERTAAEIAADIALMPPAPPTLEDEVKALKLQAAAFAVDIVKLKGGKVDKPT